MVKEELMINWKQRTELLLGEDKMARLQSAHVLVVGLGGVGAYAAEMICRAGVGRMTIVDADTVQITNLNRQLPAMHSTLGMFKADVLEARFKDINPDLELKVLPVFLKDENIPDLLDELVTYVNTTDDHPLIVAAVVHYQLVTIHPFEDGNGRIARLLSGYIMDLNGYGFNGIGSLEEYFAYDIDEYYESIQMGLPALYYSGRDNPPHPEIWISYFLRMVKLYSGKVCDLQMVSSEEDVAASLSFLKGKEKELLRLLITDYKREFTPIEVSMRLSVTNKTIINSLAVLVKNGFVIPIPVNQRIRSYELSEFTRDHEKEIIKAIL